MKILADHELPPLQPQDHPEPHSFAWTEQEMRAIRARDRLVEAAVLAKLAAQEPVAWKHSATGMLYDTESEVPLADGGEWAMPLYAAPQPAVVQVPQGYKLVPVEPTPEMLAAVVTSMDEALHGPNAEKQYVEDWKAMLAAAPQQPAPQPLTEEMVLRAAKELCRIYAGECQVDEQDTWNIYADQFKRDAKAALAAAHGIKEQP